MLAKRLLPLLLVALAVVLSGCSRSAVTRCIWTGTPTAFCSPLQHDGPGALGDDAAFAEDSHSLR
jgi:hypothetical protein